MESPKTCTVLLHLTVLYLVLSPPAVTPTTMTPTPTPATDNNVDHSSTRVAPSAAAADLGTQESHDLGQESHDLGQESHDAVSPHPKPDPSEEPTDPDDKWSVSDLEVKMAPKYMLDLYEKYRSGLMQRTSRAANTVRSIHAQVGVIRTESMFVFNLSSISWLEKIIRAEIHIYKRPTRSPPVRLRGDVIMDMHELGPTFIRRLDHRRIPEESQGWQTADVTSVLRACRHHSDGVPRMMAVKFSARDRDSERQEALSIESLVRRISRPYLIVYSNDTLNITVDHIQPHMKPSDLTASYIDPGTGLLERFSAFGRDKRESMENAATESGQDELPLEVTKVKSEPVVSLSDPEQGKFYGDNKFFKSYYLTSSTYGHKHHKKTHTHKSHHHNEVYAARVRRSVIDNEIPETPEDEVEPDELMFPFQETTEPKSSGGRSRLGRKHRKGSKNRATSSDQQSSSQREDQESRESEGEVISVPQTHPSMLQGRTRSRDRQRSDRRDGGQLIPYPENYKRKQRKHKNSRRKQRRRDQRYRDAASLRPDWDIESVMSDDDVKRLCATRTMTVDFADIGWGEWIISPRSFEANYCAGTCPFPISQRLKPSNHATIQGLVHAIGLQENVPSPCCVPERMSSVTLLFFDENQNVVLKNYPDMAVESCVCR